MPDIDSTSGGPVTQSENAPSADRLARAGVVLGVALIFCLGAYALSARATLRNRIAAVEQRTSNALMTEVQALRKENSSFSSTVSSLTERLEATTKEFEEAKVGTEALQRAHARTARAATAAAAAAKAARDDATAWFTEVQKEVSGVSTEVKDVATTLQTTRRDLADGRKELTTVTTAQAALSSRVARNNESLAELRRRGERDAIAFDIQKSSRPETWTVADIRVELRKADVRRSKYDVVLHVDDRLLERKDRTTNEPVAFLVGPEKVRYELVVTNVERDRIRGYISVPKDRTLAAERPSVGE